MNRGRRCVRRDAAGCARVGADGSLLRPRVRPRGFWTVSQETGADFAMSPWLLAVFSGGCSLSASPTWGNVGAVRRFGLIRPAKPPRSCKRGSLVLRVAHLNVCFGSAGAGHRRCDCCAVRVDARARMGGQKGIRGSLGERSSWARLVCGLGAAVRAVRRSPGFVFNACSTSLKYNRLALYLSELRPLQVAHDDLTCGGLLS